MNNLKQKIQEALTGFGSGNPTANATRLLNVLGYESERTVHLSPNNYKGFAELFHSGPSNFDTKKAKIEDWQSIDIIFQLTEDDIRKTHSLFETKKYSDKIIESYLFFALSLSGDKYTRGDLVRITREINKLTPMPAMILFKYNNYLTVAVIDRRLHKRESTKDVLEKVTLIKDIQIPSPSPTGEGRGEVHRAHIEILHDLSLDELQRKTGFSNFIELHNAWRKTLDTSELNKKFFRELANWYFWALSNVEFPDDVEKNKDIRNAISVIRLITRIIFVWFLKEKGLVPDSLFIKSRMDNILNYTDKTGSTFYKAILQNLFFATLNTEMNKDKPGNRIFVNRQYGIPNLYRYERFFKDKDKALALFESIPFLNGGLFECLDKNVGQENEIRIDCFSNSPAKSERLTVPDELFFSAEQSVDLNEIYGTKNKTYKVRGLIDILDSYKFTVDENTPIEEEIALDPELLGKVFENLLASYNPETQTTARKQTGSFYTPREIVNYMVDESIIAYLSNALENAPSTPSNVTPPPSAPPLKIRGGRGSYDERLRHLVAYNDQPHEFTPAEVDILIAAINTLKALDPACGSGAFPMGMLHKLVYILGKLDPDNSKWRDLQKQKAIKETEEAYSIGDKEEREKRLLDISEVFENNSSDYGRKLYLIENCIFGVDIQPIAVQIAKLRFFVSLIVDQRIDDVRHSRENGNPDSVVETGSKPVSANRGIRPLPNLETKFVAANTLIGIEKPEQLLLRNPEIDKKEKELKEVRERHFTARTPQTKEKYRKADEKLRAEVSELLRNDGFPSETTEKLAKWNPYDQNASADFFDPEWMFGITEGFDIVTGNPPYVDSENMVKNTPEFREELKSNFKTAKGNWDLFVVFIEKGVLLTNHNGCLSFIVPNKLISAKYTETLREFLNTKAIHELIDFSYVDVFKEADVYPIVFRVLNSNKKTSVVTKVMQDLTMVKNENIIDTAIFYKDIYWDKYFFDKQVVDLVLKICALPELAKQNVQIFGAATVNDAYNIKEIITEYKNQRHFKKFLNTGTIDPFKALWGIKQTQYIKSSYSKPIVKDDDLRSVSVTRYNQASSAKIIIAGMSIRIEAYFDDSIFLAGKSTTIILGKKEFLLALTAILNAKIVSFWFSKYFNSLSMSGGFFNVGPNELARIPIPANIDNIACTALKCLTEIIQCLKEMSHDKSGAFFERVSNAVVYELYLPKAIASVGANVLKHLNILPDIQPLISKDETEKAIKNIERVYDNLCKPDHPISVAMFKMDTIEEIRIIEGKQ